METWSSHQFSEDELRCLTHLCCLSVIARLIQFLAYLPTTTFPSSVFVGGATSILLKATELVFGCNANPLCLQDQQDVDNVQEGSSVS